MFPLYRINGELLFRLENHTDRTSVHIWERWSQRDFCNGANLRHVAPIVIPVQYSNKFMHGFVKFLIVLLRSVLLNFSTAL